MARVTIHLLRHGEVHNPDGVLYGRLPGYRLSERGRAMAERVADTLVMEGRDIRAAIASPLQRAQETAQPTASAYGLEIRTDAGLIEAENVFEGQQINKNRAQLAHPRNWRHYVNPFRPSWGEPYTEQAHRMMGAVRRALHSIDGGEALLVSHQLPIWATRLFIEGRPLAHDPRNRQCALASLTSLVFEDRVLTALTYREPAADLVAQAKDMTPGTSAAGWAGTRDRK